MIAEPTSLTPRRCTTHSEKTFTFADGTVMKSCTHDECGWGKTRKTHTESTESIMERREQICIHEAGHAVVGQRSEQRRKAP